MAHTALGGARDGKDKKNLPPLLNMTTGKEKPNLNRNILKLQLNNIKSP